MPLSYLKTNLVIHILFTLVFLVSGLIINLLQFIFFVTLWPLNKELFRKINYVFAYIIYSSNIFTHYLRKLHEIIISLMSNYNAPTYIKNIWCFTVKKCLKFV